VAAIAVLRKVGKDSANAADTILPTLGDEGASVAATMVALTAWASDHMRALRLRISTFGGEDATQSASDEQLGFTPAQFP